MPTLHLLAEPKSGTSWLNAIANTFLASCHDDACLDWQPTTVGNLDHVASSTMVQHSTRLTRNKKHAWPPIDGAPACANASFLHPTPNMPKGFPCGLSRTADKAALQRCASVCTRSDACSRSSAGSDRYLQIFRDPRDVAVSLCFWVDPGLPDGRYDESAMDACLKYNFPKFALWTKYRELWNERCHALRSRSTLVSYERLLAEPLEEYAKVAAALSLSPTQAQIAEVAARTTSEALISAQVDMKDIVQPCVQRDSNWHHAPN